MKITVKSDIEDCRFNIPNEIYDRDYNSNKYQFYPFLFNEASIQLAEKTQSTIDKTKKQINTIFISFDNGEKDLIEIGKDGELIY